MFLLVMSDMFSKHCYTLCLHCLVRTTASLLLCLGSDVGSDVDSYSESAVHQLQFTCCLLLLLALALLFVLFVERRNKHQLHNYCGLFYLGTYT